MTSKLLVLGICVYVAMPSCLHGCWGFKLMFSYFTEPFP